MEYKELLGKIKSLIQKKKSIMDIMKELDLKDYELYGLVELLKDSGYQIERQGEKFIFMKEQVIKEKDVFQIPSGTKQKLMLVSDTHLGSKYDRLDILKALYKRAQEEEIETVFHVGDLTDGNYPVRPQHEFELKAHGADEQLDYVVKNYPKVEGIQTMFISGNHDFSHMRTGGFDIGRAVGNAREDMTYLGQDVADVKYGKTRIRLFHGSKGSSYAKSYRIQKYVEQIPGDEKPDMLLMGHYHNSFYMKYADIHCFQVPAIVDQTPFARSLGLNTERGAWIVDFETQKDGSILSMKPELLSFGTEKVRIRRK